MLTAVIFRKNNKDYQTIKELYDSSFPDDERIPWQRIVSQLDESRQMHVYYDDQRFVGLSYVFIHKNVVYLSYLAVSENLRDRGYGSEILRLIQKEFRDYKIVIDIEIVDPDADNYEERRKRKDFYLRNGFVSTGTGYYIYHVDYELLSCNGIVSADEYRELVLEHWGPFAKTAVFRELS